MSIEEIIESHKELAYYSIFKKHSMKNKKSSELIPFSKESKGDFIYLTNRKFEKYSYLFECLEEFEVYKNTTFEMGYTSILICEKIEYFENKKVDFTRLNKTTDDQKMEDKYCLFQNPLNRLFNKDINNSSDIIGIYEDYKTAKSYANIFSAGTSVLLVKIKAHINWH